MKKYEEKSNRQIERVTAKDSVRERKEWRDKNVLCVCLSLYVGVLERERERIGAIMQMRKCKIKFPFAEVMDQFNKVYVFIFNCSKGFFTFPKT